MKKELIFLVSILLFQYGAGSRTRTDTTSLPIDFESIAATNYAMPASIKMLSLINYNFHNLLFIMFIFIIFI